MLRKASIKSSKRRINGSVNEIRQSPELFKVALQYQKNEAIIQRSVNGSSSKHAVVIHLFYTESWPQLNRLVRRIKMPFDLFITMPKENLSFGKQIKKDWPMAVILEAPNRGRDVLPFLKTVRPLLSLNYEHVLKLHSKKSTHRKDGSSWFQELTESLLPAKHIDQLGRVLAEKAAVVGPQGQFTSLKVNFEANGRHMTDIISQIYNKKLAHQVLQIERAEHGFFAGTMFWASLKNLRPVISKNWRVGKFEKEAGQIDGTFAHAMERVFCLVPQIEKKYLYEIGNKGIHKISYDSGVIPDWSDVYIGPKTNN